MPYSALENVIESTKVGCYRALRRTQSTLAADRPDWEAWLMFFLRSLTKQKDALARKISFVRASNEELHPLARKIAALLTDHDTLTLGQVVKLVDGKPSTVKLRLRELVDLEMLEPRGKGRGGFYQRKNAP